MTTQHELKNFPFEKSQDIALAFGCFDILHFGHVRFLQEVKRRTNLPLCVGLLPDTTVSLLKGPARPVMPENERAEIILALKSVDYAFVIKPSEHFSALKEEFSLSEKELPLWSTALCCLDVLRPKEFYYSSDFKMTPKIDRFFKDRKIKTIVVPYSEGISTSDILKRIDG